MNNNSARTDLSWGEKEREIQDQQMLAIQAIRACGYTNKQIEIGIKEALEYLS